MKSLGPTLHFLEDVRRRELGATINVVLILWARFSFLHGSPILLLGSLKIVLLSVLRLLSYQGFEIGLLLLLLMSSFMSIAALQSDPYFCGHVICWVEYPSLGGRVC